MAGSPAERPIGVFDSGVGGLTVLRELRRELPGEDFIYFGDSARAPYGPKGAETVVRYARECAAFLLERDIKLLIVACNTASSLALQALQAMCPCPVLGTIEPAVQAALSDGPAGSIAVIGTEATIGSEAYDRRLRELRPSLQIYSRACPLFVPLVEQGMLSGEIVEKIVELYLLELRGCQLDSLILGCTHYPLLKPVIAAYLGDSVRVIECSTAVAREAKALLISQGLQRNSGTGADSWFVTDDVLRFNRLAELFLEKRGISALKVNLVQGDGK